MGERLHYHGFCDVCGGEATDGFALVECSVCGEKTCDGICPCECKRLAMSWIPEGGGT